MLDQTRSLPWPEKRQGAVSLSYDGGDLSHLETVATCLDALCLHATFYAPPCKILDDPTAWKRVAAAGHEIGDAGLFDAVGEDAMLDGWTPEMVEEDLQMSHAFYRECFPNVKRRSLALPLPVADLAHRQVELAQQAAAFRPAIQKHYSVVRGSTDGYNLPAGCDLRSLRCFAVVDHTAEELTGFVESVVSAGAWVILAFAGVGVGDPAVDAVAHARFCLWLAVNRERIWVAPVVEVGMHLKKATSAAVQQTEPEGAEATLRQPV